MFPHVPPRNYKRITNLGVRLSARMGSAHPSVTAVRGAVSLSQPFVLSTERSSGTEEALAAYARAQQLKPHWVTCDPTLSLDRPDTLMDRFLQSLPASPYSHALLLVDRADRATPAMARSILELSRSELVQSTIVIVQDEH